MRASEAMARILVAEGTEFLFCFPAHGLIDACAALGIRPIVTRTERTLVNMADGYTRVHNGKRNGVCAVQAGPGAENAFAGVAQAASDGIPILVLPGGARRDRRGVPYAFSAAEAYRPIAKWTDEINLSERIPVLMRRAFHALRNGRRGPVVLEVPNDVGGANVDDAAVAAYQPARTYLSMADPAGVAEAVALIGAARSPVIVAGQGVLFAEATSALVALAELLEAPVMTTMNGKSAFPEDHPLALGAAGASGTEAAARFLESADLIVGVGTSFTVTPFTHPMPATTPLLQITADERDVNKDYPVRHALIGDVGLVLEQLRAAISGGAPRRANDARARIASTKAAWLERWRARLGSSEEPLSPYRVIAELGRTLDRANAIVTHDSGNPRDQLLPFFEAIAPRGYLGWGKSTQLGYGYGLSLGAKLAAPDRIVANVMGDAAFGMVGMDVETAARERIGVLTILLNNSVMGGYDRSMPIAAEKYGTHRLTGDYTALAKALGAHAERVTSPAAIATAIERAAKITRDGRPAVLEFVTRADPEVPRYFTPTY
ncbi:MAG TPA: thiamine pyrophosphate-requiring protein [Candidatus Acidoferrales bacterium]|nr:thiamine pyrophosphate-requiring protein [Candidatus Acidoferrales bacterium]